MTTKESIKIRSKKIANGNQSIYLDIYRNGKREYEFLKLYIIPEKNKVDKEKNKQTMAFVESIKAKRIVEMQNHEFGFNSAYKLDTNFLDYYRTMCEKRHGNTESTGNWGNWCSCLKYLEKFCKKHTQFKDIDPDFINDFKSYLEHDARSKSGKPLSQN